MQGIERFYLEQLEQLYDVLHKGNNSNSDLLFTLRDLLNKVEVAQKLQTVRQREIVTPKREKAWKVFPEQVALYEMQLRIKAKLDSERIAREILAPRQKGEINIPNTNIGFMPQTRIYYRMAEWEGDENVVLAQAYPKLKDTNFFSQPLKVAPSEEESSVPSASLVELIDRPAPLEENHGPSTEDGAVSETENFLTRHNRLMRCPTLEMLQHYSIRSVATIVNSDYLKPKEKDEYEENICLIGR